MFWSRWPRRACHGRLRGRIAINRVATLSPSDFEEEIVRTIDPPENGDFADGIHTISRFGEATLIDAKRERFNRADFWFKVRKRLRKG